jgi:type IV secretion system protein VirB6
MSGCETLTASATAGVAPALRAVDCVANEATAGAFARLFGGEGSLLPALTILLTLYIAFFAISLLTGRSRISVSALTPRMMTLGLVLTFVTSWVAYQSVVWNLAIGAPDQIAGVITGADGSATQMFADRIDILFAAVAEASQAAAAAQAGMPAQAAAAGTFSPGNLIWLAAVLLLLGTVGVLVTARIALAVLLALGPVFVVLGLFNGTRGLFAGWLRALVMTSVAPLFAVIGGGFMIELAVPVVTGLQGSEGIDGRAAMALFLVASVHVALMVMVMRVVGTMVGGWTVFGLAGSNGSDTADRNASRVTTSFAAGSAEAPAAAVAASQAASARRSLGLTAVVPTADTLHTATGSAAQAHRHRTVVTQSVGVAAPTALPPRHRPRGIGSRFRPINSIPREMMR